MKKLKVLVITGPTAIGKSRIALGLSKKLNGEIVSADSMQVYKGMDIGTAKPDKKDRQSVPHHLIDIIDPDEDFSVATYQDVARKAIEGISDCKKLPILVGGSGLYIRAAIDELDFPKGTLESRIRKKWEVELKRVGSLRLHGKLKELDPKSAGNIHPHNSKRIIRALEVIESTGHPFSDFQRKWDQRKSIYNSEIIAFILPRSELYAKIDGRVDRMIADGLIEETKKLVEGGYGKTLTSKQALGYQQVLNYLDDKISLADCINLIKRDTRRFAKRQITWLKADPRIFWIDLSDKPEDEIEDITIRHLKAKKF